jgi:hypothetical protein
MLNATETFLGTERFEILRWIGEGAVGIVYEAFDHELGTKVALKTLRNASAEAIRSLKNEFRSVQDLRHPNLVSFGELFEDRGRWFFTMELVDGAESFLEYVQAGRSGSRPFDEARLRAALTQTAEGLLALHAAGKVHRDVKPSNTLVARDGRVVILDFGIVSNMEPDESGPRGLMGSAPYMAPEQAACEPVAAAADWYAVGVMLYEALTGHLPFRGSMAEVLDEKLRSEPPPPSTLCASVPEDLDRLCSDLLRMNPVARPDGREILLRLRGGEGGAVEASFELPTVFVGRRGELRALDEAFDTVRAGHAVTVLVRGESGVGKSALARTFAERVRAHCPGAIVLSARCYEREAVPYKAVDGIVDGLAELLRTLPPYVLTSLLPDRAYLLGQVFPVLAPLCGRRPSSDDLEAIANPHEQRLRLYACMRDLFSKVARTRPLVLIVDDWQWADRDGISLVAEVLRPPGAPPLLLLVTERVASITGGVGDTELAAEQVAIPGDVRHIDLGKLPREDAEELALRLLGADQREQATAIAREAKGHPLFIDELVRQRGVIGAASGAMRLDDALWSRVTRLEPQLRRALELVAVAGTPITHDVASRAAGADLGDFIALTSPLRAERFVRTNGVGKYGTVEPYHDRVRESVLSNLPFGTRKDWHARLAVALERAAPGDVESIAVHWQGAGDAPRAAQAAVRAAADASSALAFDRAAHLYRTALELGDFLPAERRALQAKLAEALTNAGYNAEAGEVRLELARDAEPLDALDLRRVAAEQFLCSGHFDRGIELLRGALRECRIAFPVSPLLVVLYLLVFRLVIRVRGLGFRTATSAPDPRLLVRIDTARSAGVGLSMSDNIRGAYFQTRCLLLALRAGEPTRIVRALCMSVCFSAAGGTRTRARTAQMLQSAQELAAKVGTAEAEAMAATATGYYHYFLSDWGPAAECLERAETLFRDKCIGVAFELNSVRLMLYRALAFLGDVEALAERVPPVFREVEKRGDLYSSINIRTNPRMIVALAHDDPDEVAREVGQATKWLGKRFIVQHYFCLWAQAQHDLYVDAAATAMARLQAAWPGMRRSLLLHVQSIRVSMLDVRGRVAVAAAVADAARREDLLHVAERDAATLLRERQPWATALGEVVRAGVAHARGQERASEDHMRAAIESFDSIGMAMHAAAVRARLGARIGGDEGTALRERADGWLASQHVQNPHALIAMLAPGLDP